MRSSLALTLIAAGLVLVVAGLLAWAGLLSWFGRLPGDIRIERANTRIYLPLVSMLLVSVVLSLLLALLRRVK
ncbi:MAG TPA: DUF2905 domain-containing protein [Gemmatimonadales bacterium]|nr:DUF2905 domain-containing protein [Gemmatimonadales bacterium]